MRSRLSRTVALWVGLPAAVVLVVGSVLVATGALPERTTHLATAMLVGLAVGLLTATVAAAITGHVLGRRLSRMTRAVSALSEGEAAAPTRDLFPDEIGEMSRAVDDLAERLGSRLAVVQEERDRLDAVLEGMTEGVAAVDAEGRLVLVNPAFLSIVGFDARTSVLGRTLLSVVRSDALDGAARRALAGEPVLFSEAQLVTRPPRTVVITAAPVHAPGGDVTAAVVVLRDVTERRRLQSVRQDFVANVSHELKTPIASIRGYAETLLEGALDDAEAGREFTRIILDNAMRMTELVGDLLDLAALDAGAYSLEPVETRPVDVAERSAAGVARAAEAREITVAIDAPEDLPPAHLDPKALGQILVNLLDNAVKYSPPGSVVRLTIRAHGDRLELAVADAGPGIPLQARDRIFERFYRVDPGRARAVGGTGLGLSIVRNLARLMGGTVGVECPAEGGSVFRVEIPLGRPGPLPTAGPQEA